MAKGPATKIRKKQKAYEFIRARIANHEYEPGFRLVIDRIARDLELSAIPVREAIQQLEAEGYVQVIPYSGAVVQLLNDRDYHDIMDVLAILEGAATASAAKHISQTEIEELESLNVAMKYALDEFEFYRFTELNMKFHATINDKCSNAYLVEKLSQAWQRIRQVVHTGFCLIPQRMKGSVEEHEKILQLIKDAAPEEEIESYVRQHTIKTGAEVRKRRDIAR